MKSRAHILVVDDEALLRKMLRTILVREGFNAVKCTNDGETALAKLAKERFDIVITDVRMPGMDGMELLSKIKEQYPEIAVVVMTGYGDMNTPEQARLLGADEYITKPFKATEIEVIVERVRIRQLVSGAKLPSASALA